MPAIRVNGMNLYYEQQGQGKPLVLVAGYCCDLNYWIPIRAELAKHFRVILFDNRGVGRSESPDHAYTISDMATDTVKLIEQLELEKPHILGCSMGTAITQTLAAYYPQLIDKIILTTPLVSFEEVSGHAFAWLLKLREQGASEEMLVEGVLPWLFSRNFLSDPQRVNMLKEFILANPYRQSLVGQQRQFAALQQFNSRPWFKNITAPTLIIGGEEDLCTPPSHAKELAAGIPGAQLHLFSQIGHAPIPESPEKFVRIVLAFL